MEEKRNYFDIITSLGASSTHLDGIKATKEMIKIAKIKGNEKILDVGCGTGYTACYLAKKYGCKVIGIDASKKMIDVANKKAKKMQVDVNFKVANAHKLPFKDNTFDILIGESITAYLDKDKAIKEYFRVIKPKGIIVNMEFTWIKNPTKKLIDETSRVLGVKVNILKEEQWKSLYLKGGFKNLKIEIYQTKLNFYHILRKFIDQKFNVFKIIYKIITNPEINSRIKEVKNHFNKYSNYLGYGVYKGEK